MDRDGPRLLVAVDEIEHQRLDVAVEDDPDELALAIHHRAAGISADDIRGGDEVERGREIDLCFGVGPNRWQIERRAVGVLPAYVTSAGIVDRQGVSVLTGDGAGGRS